MKPIKCAIVSLFVIFSSQAQAENPLLKTCRKHVYDVLRRAQQPQSIIDAFGLLDGERTVEEYNTLRFDTDYIGTRNETQKELATFMRKANPQTNLINGTLLPNLRKEQQLAKQELQTANTELQNTPKTRNGNNTGRTDLEIRIQALLQKIGQLNRIERQLRSARVSERHEGLKYYLAHVDRPYFALTEKSHHDLSHDQELQKQVLTVSYLDQKNAFPLGVRAPYQFELVTDRSTGNLKQFKMIFHPGNFHTGNEHVYNYEVRDGECFILKDKYNTTTLNSSSLEVEIIN